MEFPWGHNRRINLASNHSRLKFGQRIQKVTIDAGFSCPNRDGAVSTGGCTFCDNNAFNPSYCTGSKPIKQQIEEGMAFHKKRYRKAGKYMAYFQAYSNTYATVDILRKRYLEALECEDVIGLVIGTRPDCIDEKKLDLLEELNRNYELIVEYGIESVFDSTLKLVNRGHDFATTRWAIEQTSIRNITTGGHIIFGLPGESRSMMMESAGILSALPLNTIKFHQLQIVKGTIIGKQYLENPNAFKQFELDEYIQFIIEYLELLRPDIIVERLAGETQPDYNLSKKWNIRYDRVLQMIEKEMEKQNTWQGKKYIE